MIYKSNAGNEFEVLYTVSKNKRSKWIIRFLETGTVREVYAENAKAGKVRDQYSKTCYGIGWWGDYEKLPYTEKAKQLWRNMMKRCYSDKDSKGYKYKRGTTVDSRWHCFANFLSDLSKLKNFDKWVEGGSCSKTRYTLDKDMVCYAANIYSIYTCTFETESDNKRDGAVRGRQKEAQARLNASSPT